MKTEEFDSIFKEKLGSLQPEFREEDWTRLQYKMQGRDRFITGFPLRVLMGVLAVVFLGTAAWYLKQGVFGSQKLPQNKSEVKSMPIFADAGLRQQATSGIPSTPASQVAAGPSNRDAKNSEKGRHFLGSASSNDGFNKIQTALPSPGSNTAIVKTEADLKSNSNAQSSPVDVQGESLPQVSEENSTTASSGMTMEDALTVLPALPIDPVISELEGSAPHFSKIKTRKGQAISRWMAGVGFLITKSHYSAGLRTEVRLNNNISLNSGIMQQNYFVQQYSNQLEFESDHAVEFNELAIPRHSKTTEFTNIRIRSTDWVLPLELKYTYPLSTSSAVSISGGLQLSLKSKTLLDFDYLSYDTNEMLKETGLDQAYNSATLINNFIFGLGYQRNFRKWNAQIALVYQKSNSNLPSLSKKDLGLQTGISYRF